MQVIGSSHVHGNRLESDTIRLLPHIHIATDRYISIAYSIYLEPIPTGGFKVTDMGTTHGDEL